MGQLDTRYRDLIEKIEQARRLDYTITTPDGNKVCPYEIQRQQVVEQYFSGGYDEKGKKYLLDLFDNSNNTLKNNIGVMKQKTGHCIDCPADSEDKPLIAKRCQTHYWKYRKSVSAKKPSQVARKEVKTELNVYFASEVQKIPAKCQECGKPFCFSQPWMRRAAVAHILGKAQFPSIATHPQNRWFGCLQCHTDYDNRGSQHVVTMKIFNEIKQRVQPLLLLLTRDERRKVPEYFL